MIDPLNALRSSIQGNAGSSSSDDPVKQVLVFVATDPLKTLLSEDPLRKLLGHDLADFACKANGASSKSASSKLDGSYSVPLVDDDNDDGLFDDKERCTWYQYLPTRKKIRVGTLAAGIANLENELSVTCAFADGAGSSSSESQD